MWPLEGSLHPLVQLGGVIAIGSTIGLIISRHSTAVVLRPLARHAQRREVGHFMLDGNGHWRGRFQWLAAVAWSCWIFVLGLVCILCTVGVAVFGATLVSALVLRPACLAVAPVPPPSPPGAHRGGLWGWINSVARGPLPAHVAQAGAGARAAAAECGAAASAAAGGVVRTAQQLALELLVGLLVYAVALAVVLQLEAWVQGGGGDGGGGGGENRGLGPAGRKAQKALGHFKAVAARALEPGDRCAICFADLEPAQVATSGPPVPLEHCGWGCGNSVHEPCMAQWGESWARGGRSSPLPCVYCGAPWLPPADPPVFRKSITRVALVRA